MNELPRSVYFDYLPRSVPGTKAAPNPTRQPPHPPARDLDVEKVWVAFHVGLKRILLADQPGMSSMQVVLVHWPICVIRHGHWVRLDRSPEIRQEPIGIVDRLNAIEWHGPIEEHRPAAEKRLNIVADIAEPRPHKRGDLSLSAKPRERSFQTFLKFCHFIHPPRAQPTLQRPPEQDFFGFV